MKLFFAILFILGFTVTTYSQSDFRVVDIRISPKGLQEAVDDYLTDNKEDLTDIGVIVVKIDASNSVYYLTHKMFESEIKERMPSYYSLYKNRVVVFYTGFESNLNIQPSKNEKFLKLAAPFFAQPNSIYYHAPIWKVKLKHDQYEKEFVDSLPLPY